MKVLVLYFSKTGHTLEAANATAAGIRSVGSEADIVTAGDFQPSMIADCDALIVGSPCRSGSVTSTGVAKPIRRALDSLPGDCLAGRRCGGISVNSTTGGNTTVTHLGELVNEKGCADYRPGPVAKAGVPLSLWKGPSVSAEDSERFKAYGAEFVA